MRRPHFFGRDPFEGPVRTPVACFLHRTPNEFRLNLGGYPRRPPHIWRGATFRIVAL